MKLIEVIKALVAMAEADTEDRYFEIVQAIALIFPTHLVESLTQLVNGPVWDGDVISKVQRGELSDAGIAIRVCCKGEQGYTGAKYIGFTILKAIKELNSK